MLPKPPRPREIQFFEGDLSGILSGEQKESLFILEIGVHEMQVDELFLGIFPEGVSLNLRATELTATMGFAELNDDRAVLCGYADADHARLMLELAARANLPPETLVAIIHYEVVK